MKNIIFLKSKFLNIDDINKFIKNLKQNFKFRNFYEIFI